MSSGAGVGDIPGAEGSKGCFFRGGVPMIQAWALWYGPFGVRQRPKLPAGAEGDELARIFRQYSVTVPDFRSPEYAEALQQATLQAPSGRILRRMGSPLTGYETFMAVGPASPAWKAVDLIDASHTGATPTINITGSGSGASPRRTTSRPATGSASRSQAPASRSPTATGMPATATTWPPTARSPTSPCTTDKVTSRRCTSAPTPARSRSTRRCPAPGPAAGGDRTCRRAAIAGGPADAHQPVPVCIRSGLRVPLYR